MTVEHALAVADQAPLDGTPQSRALSALARHVRAAQTGYTGVPVRWDVVGAGAVFEGASGLWWVEEAPKDRADRHAVIRSGDERHELPVERADTIDVLYPLAEVVAAQLVADELGAQPIAAAS